MTGTVFYIGDPMCSWCWGFGPALAAVEAGLPAEVPLCYVMGGLAPDSDEPMAPEVRAYVQKNWRAVEAGTGASFNWDFWERCLPRRSTYPACRAVLAAQLQDAGPAMFRAVQSAYYTEARNPSDLETLTSLAAGLRDAPPAGSPRVSHAAVRSAGRLREEGPARPGVGGAPRRPRRPRQGTRRRG